MYTLKYENRIFFFIFSLLWIYSFNVINLWRNIFQTYFSIEQPYIALHTHIPYTGSPKHQMKQKWDHLIQWFNGIVPENIINSHKAPPQTLSDLERHFLKDKQ